MHPMKTSCLLSLITCLSIAAGCSDEPGSGSGTGPAVDGSRFLLTAEPDGARDVIEVREEAKDQDDVVIVGRIGGSANPWVEGRAAFSIVDMSLKSCDEIGSDDCPKPWDFC